MTPACCLTSHEEVVNCISRQLVLLSRLMYLEAGADDRLDNETDLRDVIAEHLADLHELIEPLRHEPSLSESPVGPAAKPKTDQSGDEPMPPNDQPVDDHPVDDQPVNDQPVDDQPVDDQPVDDQTTDDDPAAWAPLATNANRAVFLVKQGGRNEA